MFCGKCGAEIGKGNSYCGKCGNPLSDIAMKSVVTPAYSTGSKLSSVSATRNKKRITIILALSIVLIIVVAVIIVVSTSNNIEQLSGTWEYDGGGSRETYEFFGNTYTYTETSGLFPASSAGPGGSGGLPQTFSSTEKGTYSLSKGKIELIDEYGYISVYDFSRTDNTIKIGGTRYSRK